MYYCWFLRDENYTNVGKYYPFHFEETDHGQFKNKRGTLHYILGK
jgi:hypothetical protein